MAVVSQEEGSAKKKREVVKSLYELLTLLRRPLVHHVDDLFVAMTGRHPFHFALTTTTTTTTTINNHHDHHHYNQ